MSGEEGSMTNCRHSRQVWRQTTEDDDDMGGQPTERGGGTHLMGRRGGRRGVLTEEAVTQGR